MIREKIEQAVEEALEAIDARGVAFVVERPSSMEHGDYATNAALALAKSLKKNPKEVAETLKEELEGKVEGVEKIEIAGAGFINFFISRTAITKEILAAAGESEWGKNDLYKNKTVMVEYTSPNLFKPLHIGNLVGNVLGESLARLMESAGAEVKRINYPSDIGLTVAKGIWGLKKLNLDPTDIAQLGKAYVEGNKSYEDDAEAKDEIDAINLKLYEGSDSELNGLREVGITTSRRRLKEILQTLGTTFDTEFFESETAPVGKDIVLTHLEDGIFEKSDGAIIYRGENDGLHTRVFINSQGLPTYEAKDLGLFKLKNQKYPEFDISITDTGPEQKEYFKVIIAAIKKVFPETAHKALIHTAHGFLKLTTGKMSSRLGNVVTGESLLMGLKEDAKEKMKERELLEAEKIAEQVAVGAIKYAVLKQGSGRDIIFDPEKSLSLEGDSGPYLQYAHTRALSLLREAKKAGIEDTRESYFTAPGEEDAKSADLETPRSRNLLERLLLHFPDAVSHAAEELEPHYVTTYLTELASAFNSWYASERVIGGSNPQHGVLLARAVEATLAKGLNILGIPAPEEM